MNKIFRKTKIICTIGPATSSLEMLEQLAKEGMTIARLNMSHGDHTTHLEVIRRIRTLNKKIPMPIGILLDTQGPEIRTGEVKEAFTLKVGEIIDISVGGGQDVEERSTIFVNYRDMIKDMNTGDKITVDNGLINLTVIEKSAFGLKCRVDDGGVMKSRRHINLPGIRVNLPAITTKDEADIIFGVKNDIDFIALSFVRSPADVEECKRLIARHNGHALVIAKIEDQFGVENYREIIRSASGVMVARGDLGVEVPIEELPIIQRRILKESAAQGKRAIIATHLLESMIENPLPTRAEVTDVANAAFEEADSVMLYGETTIGKYPIKAVQYLNKILLRIEQSGGIEWARHRAAQDRKAELARAASELADRLKADAIVIITRRGIMAEHVSSFHPTQPVILAFTNMSAVRRKLLLHRAVYPWRIDFSQDPEKTIQNAFTVIKKRKLLQSDSTVVIVSDVLAGEKRVDAIQVRQIVDDPV